MAKVLCFNQSAEARNACSIPVLDVEVNVEDTSAVVSSIIKLKHRLAHFGWL